MNYLKKRDKIKGFGKMAVPLSALKLHSTLCAFNC
jgi:hypothetical protein